jgi:hypothetical protein
MRVIDAVKYFQNLGPDLKNECTTLRQLIFEMAFSILANTFICPYI